MDNASSLLGLALSIIGPVLGFILIALGVYFYMKRNQLRPEPEPSGMRSNLGLPLNDLDNLVRKYYKAQGYDIIPASDNSARTVELIALKDTERTVVWCRAEAEPPDAKAIEQLSVARESRKATRAIFIAQSGFASEARQRAIQLGIELRDAGQINLMRTMAEQAARA
jgi:hypothetical protein